MENQDDIIQEAIGYSFKGISRFVLIEDIVHELKLESDRYWMRPSTPEDWFEKGDWIILRQEPDPILIDEYDLTYDIPYNDKNISKVKFAEFLIDSYIEYIGYLEACMEKEIDNKKEENK